MKHIILSICLFTLLSCVSQKREVIAKSVIKLEGKDTNIRGLIEIGGYYSTSEYPDSDCRMFFEDGTWVYFHLKKGVSDSQKQANMSKAVTNWIKDGQHRWGAYWGVYEIKNDTIIVYRYDEGGILKSWGLSEERYKILNRETIQRIYYRCILKPADDYYKTHSPWIYDQLLHFTPADSLPSSDNWLKENKWIWQNESDWKEYMQKIEQKKKQFKK